MVHIFCNGKQIWNAKPGIRKVLIQNCFCKTAEKNNRLWFPLFSVTGTWYLPPGGGLVPPPAHQFPNALNLSNPHCDRLSFRNSRHAPYSHPYQRRSPPGKLNLMTDYFWNNPLYAHTAVLTERHWPFF